MNRNDLTPYQSAISADPNLDLSLLAALAVMGLNIWSNHAPHSAPSVCTIQYTTTVCCIQDHSGRNWGKSLLWLTLDEKPPWWETTPPVPTGSPSRGGDVMVYVLDTNQPSLPTLLFCSCIYFYLYGPFNCISFHKFPKQLSTFLLCFSGLISASVLSTMYLFTKVSFSPVSPDVTFCGWLGLKHQLTN